MSSLPRSFVRASRVTMQSCSVCYLHHQLAHNYLLPSILAATLTPLYPVHINPASSLILDLLGDILVYFPICKLEVKAGAFHQHQCSPQSMKDDRDELQTTTSVIQQFLSQSPENVVELPTRGTVSHSHTHMHAYMHMHTHTRTYAHTHTHTHIGINSTLRNIYLYTIFSH